LPLDGSLLVLDWDMDCARALALARRKSRRGDDAARESSSLWETGQSNDQKNMKSYVIMQNVTF